MVSGHTHPVFSVHKVPLLPGECWPAQPLQEEHQLLLLGPAARADLEQGNLSLAFYFLLFLCL